MLDIMKMKYDGAEIYPQTHVKAVIGLESGTGPQGPQGPKGDPGPEGTAGNNATTTAIATQTVNGLMSAVDKKKLDDFSGITFEKVGSV